MLDMGNMKGVPAPPNPRNNANHDGIGMKMTPYSS